MDGENRANGKRNNLELATMPNKGSSDITYPPGCKELSDDLKGDELLRRLKFLASAFQDMSQDDTMKYTDLAVHLASDFFLEHNNKDVRLFVACCIADVFRVCAPEAPYTEPDMIKNIFLFITQELKGLEDPDSPSFKRYFYLLENLAWVKSFNICLDLEDNQEIFCGLMKMMFSIINERHSSKVINFILDMLAPLITESDAISPVLLDIILVNILEPHKTQERLAYNLSKDLIKRTANAMEPSVQSYLNNILMLGKNADGEVAGRLYDLIYELNSIAPSVLLSVLPQLEFKLKSGEAKDRIKSTRLLCKMFSDAGSDLAVQNKPLWLCFLGRFNDINTDVRRICVRGSMEFILNHPELVKDIADPLKQRQHDADETVRMSVIQAIVGAGMKDPTNLTDGLLECVRGRTLDKKFKIRKEALLGLGHVYKRYMQIDPLSDSAEEHCTWIRNKILHAYYRTCIDDRIIVERLLNTSLVPYSLDADQRMQRLFYLYGGIDEYAVKALNELFKTQLTLRVNVRSFVDCLQTQEQTPEIKGLLQNRLRFISRNLPDPAKNLQYLKKFQELIATQPKLRQHMARLLAPDCTCKMAEECVKEILKRMGNPVPQNFVYLNARMLLERVAPVMIDREAIESLMDFTEEIIHDRNDATMRVENAIGKSMELLQRLSGVFPGSFHTETILNQLITLVKHQDDDESVADGALEVFSNIGAKLQEDFPIIYQTLIPVLTKLVKIGSPRQTKHSIRCIQKICKSYTEIFETVFEHLKKNMDLESPYFISSLVAVGHIAQICPGEFAMPVKSIITKFIVKQLLMQDRGQSDSERSENWCDDDLVSEETMSKLQGLKLMVRWLVGIKDENNNMATSTLRLLYTLILHDGDLMESGKINKAEMARLRLQAGCCMLRLAREMTVYADLISLEQFQTIALLINDPCYEVRLRFSQKLHRYLLALRLPLQYMSILSLASNDPVKDRRIQAKAYIANNVAKRREYLKQNNVQNKIYSILPDYVLPYAIHLLAHDPDLKDCEDVTSLKNIRECLWFLMEPLITKTDTYSFGFYRKLIENIKQTKDMQDPDCDETNHKLYAVCDLAMGVVMTKTTTFVLKDFPVEPSLPAKLYTKIDLTTINTRSYLPEVLQISTKKKGPVAMIAPAKKTTTNNNVSKNVNDTSENLPDKSTEDVSEMLDSSMEEETSQEPSDGTTQETDMSQDPAQETEVTKSGPGRPARRGRSQKSQDEDPKPQSKITDFVTHTKVPSTNTRVAPKKRSMETESSGDESVDQENESPVKKARGRPKKDAGPSKPTNPSKNAPTSPVSSKSSISLSPGSSPRRSNREITPSEKAAYIKENVMKKKGVVNGVTNDNKNSTETSKKTTRATVQAQAPLNSKQKAKKKKT